MRKSRGNFSIRLVLCLLGATLFAGIGDAQNLKVTLLGTGSPQPRMDRFGPSILVEAGGEKLVFDCGRGATQRLEQIKIHISEITGLFLTHLHSDHVVGIPDLWLTGWLTGRKVPLRVWGPRGTKNMMTHLQEAFEFDIHIRRDVDEKLPGEGALAEVKDVEEGVVYEHAGLKVTAFFVDHGLVTPAMGYRVDFEGHSVVLSGDTRPSENLVHWAKGTDLLIHEVIDPEAFIQERGKLFKPEMVRQILGHHTTPEQAGTIFETVKPKLAVYSHVTPGNGQNFVVLTRQTYAGPLEVGEDLMSMDVGEKVVVQRPVK
jgi:ribonuclease Z